MYLDPPAGYRVFRKRVFPAEEGRRVLRLCHPCRIPDAAPTFVWRGGSAEDAWAVWREAVFEPWLGPALVGALHAARMGHGRDLAAADASLDHALPAEAAARSRSHGRRLLIAMIPPVRLVSYSVSAVFFTSPLRVARTRCWATE